jgi:hypothetical protein
MKLGIEKTAMIRARAGISFALTEALDEGHCGLPRDDLLPLAVKLLEIPGAIVTDALWFELEAGAPSHMLVHVPEQHRDRPYEVAIRQLYAGREVGRITWRLVP